MRAPGGEIEVNRTDHRGTYAGAFFAYLDLPIGALVQHRPARRHRLPLLGAARRRLRLGGAGVVPDGHPHAGGVRHPGDGLPADGQHPRAPGRPRHRHRRPHPRAEQPGDRRRPGHRHPGRAPGRPLGRAGRAGRGGIDAGQLAELVDLVRQAVARPRRPGAAVPAGGLRPRGRAGRLAGGARRRRRLGPGAAAGRRRGRRRLARAGRRHRPGRGAAPRRRGSSPSPARPRACWRRSPRPPGASRP